MTNQPLDGLTRLIMKLQSIHDSSTPWTIRDQLQTYINELEAARIKRLESEKVDK